ncbi:MAG: integrase arm-type DNA-binding domain-containing protein, partial [Acidobacteriota bacterium]
MSAVKVRQEARPGRYRDGGGLMLYIDRTGARRWVLRIVAKGRRVDVGLGSALTVKLADAREEAARLRRIARAGGDPLAERQKGRRAVPSFAEAARTVHGQLRPTFRNPKHAAQWLSSVERYAATIADRPIDAIGTADVLKALTPIWTSKPETARRVKQRIQAVLEWGRAAGFCQGDNPAAAVTRVLPKVRASQKHHAAPPYGLVPAFLRDLHETSAGRSTKLAFEWLILTATRTTETLRAEWSEIDRDAKVWTIPAARMKAGRPHVVPLSDRALVILDEAAAIGDGGPFIFCGRPSRPLSGMVFLMCLRSMERRDFVPHGLRSSFRDWSAERSRAPRDVVEAALAHRVRDKTEAAYFRSDLLERRRGLM